MKPTPTDDNRGIIAGVNVGTAISNSLTVLADQVRVALAESGAAEGTAIMRAIDAGQLLCEAKEACQHGAWLPFLTAAGVGERKAQRYMQLARSGLKPDTVADLGGIKATLRWLERLRLPGPGQCLLVSLDGFARDRTEPAAIVWRDAAGPLFAVFSLLPGDDWSDVLRRPIVKTDAVSPCIFELMGGRHSDMSFAVVDWDQGTARSLLFGGGRKGGKTAEQQLASYLARETLASNVGRQSSDGRQTPIKPGSNDGQEGLF